LTVRGDAVLDGVVDLMAVTTPRRDVVEPEAIVADSSQSGITWWAW
jgi:hypothetical protein